MQAFLTTFSAILSWLLLLASSVSGHAINERDDPSVIEQIYSQAPADTTFEVSDFNAASMRLNEGTQGDLIWKVKIDKHMVYADSLIGVVTDSLGGFWIFGMDGATQNKIQGPDEEADFLEIKESDAFKQIFDSAILGYGGDKQQPKPVKTTLREFLGQIKGHGKVVHAFILMRNKTKDIRKTPVPKRRQLLRAIVSRLEGELNGVKVEWLPGLAGRGREVEDFGLGGRLSHRNDLMDTQETPGVELQVYYGKDRCLKGEFLDYPNMHVSDFRLEPNTKILRPINTRLDANNLWRRKDYGFEEEDKEGDFQQKGGSALALNFGVWEDSVTAHDGPWEDSVTGHDNKNHRAGIITAITNYGTWSLVFKIPEWLDDQRRRRYSAKDYREKSEQFRKFVTTYLEDGTESIGDNWQATLQVFSPGICEGNEESIKLIDIIIVWAVTHSSPTTSQTKNLVANKEFWTAVILEMLRIAGDDPEDNDGDVQMGGVEDNGPELIAIDMPQNEPQNSWLAKYLAPYSESIQGNYFIIWDGREDNLQGLKQKGYFVEILYGDTMWVRWEFGVSGDIKRYPYEDPRNRLRNLEVPKLA